MGDERHNGRRPKQTTPARLHTEQSAVTPVAAMRTEGDAKDYPKINKTCGTAAA